MTGLPMAVEIAAPTAAPIRSCCDRAIRALSGHPQDALKRPSCCVIRASSGPPFIARAAEQASLDTLAVLPQPIDAVAFVQTTAKVMFGSVDPRAPRGPPRYAISPRAPPFLS